LYGDWDKSINGLEQLSRELRAAAEKATKKNAMLARDAVKKRIRNQDPDWEKLKETTILRKGSSKMLIDHGDLMNSITFEILSPYRAFVGVLRTARRSDTAAPLVNIARVHEYGFQGMVTHGKTGTKFFLRIPPRPYLGPTIRSIERELFLNWQNEVAAAIVRAV